MADVKISALPAAAEVLLPQEIPVNDAGTTKKLTVQQLLTELHKLSFTKSDFLSTGTQATAESDDAYGIFALSGGGAFDHTSMASVADHPGIVVLKSIASANTGCGIGSEVSAIRLGGGESYETIFNIITLTTPTIRCGFHDCTSSADAVDGVYIEIPSSGAAVGKTSNNSTRSTTGTSVTLSAGTWYRARIDVNSDASQVDFYIFSDAGTQLWHDSLTTNIPTGAGRETGIRLTATNGDASAVSIIGVDYMANWRMCARG